MFCMNINNITLSQLRTFVALIESGSFTSAARTLNVTQPGVSHTIAGLERELDVSLVFRGRRGVVPTDMGESVLLHAREVIKVLERMVQEAEASTGLLAGRIRIGSFPSAASRLLPSIIGGFNRRYPEIEVVLMEGTDANVREMIFSRNVDVGFVSLPSDGLETLPVAEDEILALVPTDHALSTMESVDVESIAGEPFIMSRGGCEPLIRSIFRSSGLTPDVRFDVRDMETILALVAEGLGVSLAPKLALPHSLKGVRAIPLHPSVRRKLALAVHSLETVSPATIAFMEQAQANRPRLALDARAPGGAS